MAKMGPRRRLALALAGLALLAAGCGAQAGEGGKHPDYSQLEDGPPPLAALYRQANRILPGGAQAYDKRIASLRGYPIVVNAWASWCGPCRFEFPIFQRLSARYGKRVAFLGIDGEDDDANAEEFLEEDPVPYPSYSDPDRAITTGIGIPRGYPDTIYYDRDGNLCYFKRGQYADDAALEADFRAYALSAKDCESG